VGLAAVPGGVLKVPNLVPLPVLWNLLKVQNFGESPRVTWLTEILVKANARGQVLVWNHRHTRASRANSKPVYLACHDKGRRGAGVQCGMGLSLGPSCQGRACGHLRFT
jgi:hypothetical protein